MEEVLQELRRWGELMILTAGGEEYEIHLGDSEFDLAARVIRLKTPEAEYVISGDAVEAVKKHYGRLIRHKH